MRDKLVGRDREWRASLTRRHRVMFMGYAQLLRATVLADDPAATLDGMG